MSTHIRQIRSARGMTMTALAIASAIPMAALSRIEQGARCSQVTAEKIAKALGIDVQELFPTYSTLRPF
jgi:transcriptional regulator with XRE-family HTH domain